ncbi:alpha/beta hydrolase [Mycobacterium intermedium]|uniref:Alpha/beta hydrolase n=1 Tax=Mycobacterium intermedium TaxID=28445 RepID=A0A1E3SBH7_MYCIE|nr:alpha/beta fold hydrolase [Mycobacterium intermedium]MCV6965834.1 alpha/beta fold hydrolase [Mycobacterium intermedium]ODQ99469.1 alpha/beta hydrolase [Mycobacterium intermedium]OPE50761.1 alpha/beta hydrolase [Mycobacterium intermedium]ORB10038.1 alpha/beta hydrolase [Mycobacterium intermedium]
MSSTSRITASDGVALAVHQYTDIDPQRPTILAIHGWPDNHHIWDGVAAELAARYNFVAYDVRGAGESSCPATRSGYRLAQLVADVDAVIESLHVGQVHLLAHDWGSVQGWAAVTDESLAGKIASFTSLSGPHLQGAGRFLRSARGLRSLANVAKQIVGSSYIAFFLSPVAPELAFRSGIGVKVVEALERIGGASSRGGRVSPPRSIGDFVNGLNLYRENLPGPLLSPEPRLPETDVSVQVLAPRQDYFISPPLQRLQSAISLRSRVISIQGGHWVVTSHPDVVAQLTAQWIEAVARGEVGAAIDRGDSRPAGGGLALVSRLPARLALLFR